MKKLFLSMMLMAAGVLGWAQNANNDAFKSIDVDEFQKHSRTAPTTACW